MYPFISIPGYRTDNSPTPSSAVFCPLNQSSYAVKSVVVSNDGSLNGATLTVQNGGNDRGMAMGICSFHRHQIRMQVQIFRVFELEILSHDVVCGSVICQNGGICRYMGASGYQCQCDSSGRWLGNDCSKCKWCFSDLLMV